MNPYDALGLVPLKGETHLHTLHSDGQATPREMLTACRQAGYDFSAITDHNTVSGIGEARAAAEDLGLVLVPGVELTTFRGHAVCLGVERLPEWRDLDTRGVDAFAAEVHALGGMVCVCHPIRLGSPACSGCAWEWPISPESVDLWEIFSAPNPMYPHPELSQQVWRQLLAAGGRAAPVAAGDVHSVAAAAAPRAATYVYARERSTAAVLEGLRARRLYASTGPRLDVWLEGADGAVALAGGAVTASDGWRVRAALAGAAVSEALQVRLVAAPLGGAPFPLADGDLLAPDRAVRVYAEAVEPSPNGELLRALTAPISTR